MDGQRDGWMDRGMDDWIEDGWMNRGMDGWMDRSGQIDRRMDGQEWIDRQKNGCMDGWRNGWIAVVD